MIKLDHLHVQHKSRPKDINLEQNYKAVRNKVVSEIGNAKFKNIKNLDTSLSSNIGSKQWWKMTAILNNGRVNNLNDTSLLDGNSVITDDYARAICLTNVLSASPLYMTHKLELPLGEINPEVLIK